MSAIPRGELKARFGAEYRAHLDRWEYEHAEPTPPSSSVVQAALEAGRFHINPETLAEACSAPQSHHSPHLFEIIVTPAIDNYLRARAARELARETFEKALLIAQREYLDRILFDHESAYLLLRDFRDWRPTP